MSWYHFLALFWGQNITWVFRNLRVFTFFKSMMVVQIGSFCWKLRTFTDQNRSNGGPHENELWLFSNTKMNVTNTIEKVDEVICLVFKFPSWVMALHFPRKEHFLQFCADFSKKPKSVKAIYIFHQKVLPTFFQQIWILGVWPILYEILPIKISKHMLTQQKFNKIVWFRALISPKCIYVNCFNRLWFECMLLYHMQVS